MRSSGEYARPSSKDTQLGATVDSTEGVRGRSQNHSHGLSGLRQTALQDEQGLAIKARTVSANAFYDGVWVAAVDVDRLCWRRRDWPKQNFHCSANI